MPFINFSVTPVGSGLVSLNPFPDPSGFPVGTVVTVGYQIPSSQVGKYEFDHWVLDGVNNTSPTLSITIGEVDTVLVLVMKAIAQPTPQPNGLLLVGGIVTAGIIGFFIWRRWKHG